MLMMMICAADGTSASAHNEDSKLHELHGAQVDDRAEYTLFR